MGMHNLISSPPILDKPLLSGFVVCLAAAPLGLECGKDGFSGADLGLEAGCIDDGIGNP